MDRSFLFSLLLLFSAVASTVSAGEINGGGDDDLLIEQVVSSDGGDDLLLHAEHHFSSFKARFGKSYGSVEEHDYRFGVFKANLRRAKLHQKLDPSAEHGVTKFSDLTPAEFRRNFLAQRSFTFPALKSIYFFSCSLFSLAMVDIFSEEYLRSPNNEDIARLLAHGESRGFLGMLGNIDCMHWKWKNCPTAYKGQFSGHIREPTIILETVASYDLWIWHTFFELHGSNNDINVLERSNIFSELAEERAPAVNYSINGNDYTMGYYLADGTYSK
ncbi:hypothetical protein SO802_005669 [Lithocarpus litseifolius]|uniref:Cathepsin propeptide inhibitor domain-containing protein n=1 Tax=Lithocarpus litseifolius TaxID=425828 RepID=A0AAW2DNF0_9ROSI